jgi:hypothetical protein
MQKTHKKLFSLTVIMLCIVLFSCFIKLSKDLFVDNIKAMEKIQTQTLETFTPIREEMTNTKAYKLNDNDGYNIDNKTASADHPLGGNYASISLQVKGGEIIDPNVRMNGVPAYAYNSNEELAKYDKASIELALKYNYSTDTQINGTSWGISTDSYKSSINGINDVGKVKTGALLVLKSKTGDIGDWTWDNSFTGDKTESFHTTDFVNNYKPNEYDGQTHNDVTRSRKIQNEDGSLQTDEDGNYKYEEYKTDIDGYLPIYTPKGEDIAQGYFYRVLFAYELSQVRYSNRDASGRAVVGKIAIWSYINVVEETVLYICNGSTNVLFQNMNFSTSLEKTVDYTDLTSEEIEEKKEQERQKALSLQQESELIRNFGNVETDNAVNDAFRVNFNGNKNIDVKYSKNGSSFTSVYDGRIFMEPGKYVFTVTPKVGGKLLTDRARNTTIYINDRGLNQNSKYYFNDGLITSSSQRIFAETETVPVYKVGAGWYINEVNENHMPISGRIGYFLETLTKSDFEKKYEGDKTIFTFNTRIGVDGDYVRQYDNDEKPTDDYSEETINEQIIKTISGYDVYKIVFEKINNIRTPFNGNLTQAGEYIAEFANNKDYFTNSASGDVMYFTFQFKVTDENIMPFINQNLFETNISFVDYASHYYGVEIPIDGKCLNTGVSSASLVYALTNRIDAESFSYDYYRSLVLYDGVKYTFNNATYTSYNSMMESLITYSREKVIDRYFDASNSDSYLTVESAVYCTVNPNGKAVLQRREAINNEQGDITGYKVIGTLKTSKDIIVFNEANTTINAVGPPFLNNRPYSYIDENNEIVNGWSEVKFIQVKNYESSSVELYYIDGDSEIPYGVVSYGATVQVYLESKNAPSGKYKIVETNGSGTTEYYGIYLRNGDNTVSIDITRVNGANVTDQLLSKEYANTSFTVNSFIIKSAVNEFDPYGIIKITNKQGDVNIIKQLDEVDNIILDKQGEYTISLVDRLGNVINFYVNIYTPSEVHNLTLINNGVEYFKQLASGGQRVDLDTLPPTNSNYEFIGWADEKGNIYNNSFLFGFIGDTVLTAVWHFKATAVSVYDGGLIRTYDAKDTKVGQTLILPNDLTRAGLEFYGYKYVVDGQVRYCIGQLNSVPNVANLRLDAIWLDTNDSITAMQGQTLYPKTKDGYTFYGWATQTRGLNAIVVTDGLADTELTEPTTLYALYTANETVPVSPQGLIAGITNTISNIASGVGSFVTLFVRNGSLYMVMSAIMLLACAVLLIRRKTLVHISNKTIYEKSKKVILPKMKSNFKWCKLLTPSICCLLVLVFGTTANYKLVLSIQEICRKNKQEVEIKRQIDDYKSELALGQQEKQITEQVQQDYIVQANKHYIAPQNNICLSGVDDENEETTEELSDEDAFLYSLVFLDLTAFGYDVFPAVATLSDTTKRKGFAYTTYNEVYTDENDKIFFGSGFIGLIDEGKITPEQISDGVTLEPIIEESEEPDTDYGCVVSFEEQYDAHYVAYGKYVHYTMKDFVIEVKSIKNESENIDGFLKQIISYQHKLTNTDGDLEYLYSYDLDRVIYDPQIGKAFENNVFSTLNSIDYDYALELYNQIILNQDANYNTVETFVITTISVEAINEYNVTHQIEAFMGLSAEQIYFVESQISNSQYYYIDGVTGEVRVLEILADPPKGSNFWNVLSWVMAGVQIVGGIITIVTSLATIIGTAGTATPLAVFSLINGVGMIVGGVAGIVSLVTKDPNAATFAGGIGAISSGAECTMVGIRMLANPKSGTAGKITGGVCIFIGIIAAGFGVNEVVSSFTGTNTLKEWMGDDLYNGLYMGSTIAATILSIAGNVYLRNLAKKAKLAGQADEILMFGEDGKIVKVDTDFGLEGKGKDIIIQNRHGEEELFNRTCKITPPKNSTVWATHGSPTKISINGKWTDNADDVVKFLYDNGYESGKNLILISCETGQDANGIAQQIANKLPGGAVVLAPSQRIGVTSLGLPFVEGINGKEVTSWAEIFNWFVSGGVH